ncbi:MAG: Uma2 family endonuclease, partial [Trebonia sp.]
MAEPAVEASAIPSAPALPEPQGSEWTWADLQALPEGGPKTEIVEGALTVSPKPARNHQYAVLELAIKLRDAAPPDLVVLPESDLELTRNVFEPDIVVLRAEAFGGSVPLHATGVLLTV